MEGGRGKDEARTPERQADEASGLAGLEQRRRGARVGRNNSDAHMVFTSYAWHSASAPISFHLATIL